MLREKEITGLSGWFMVPALLALLGFATWMLVGAVRVVSGFEIVLWIVVQVLAFAGLFGATVVNPNEAKVVQLFGTYKGSIKEQGFWWVNPLTVRRRVSLRIRNFESGKLKVND